MSLIIISWNKNDNRLLLMFLTFKSWENLITLAGVNVLLHKLLSGSVWLITFVCYISPSRAPLKMPLTKILLSLVMIFLQLIPPVCHFSHQTCCQVRVIIYHVYRMFSSSLSSWSWSILRHHANHMVIFCWSFSQGPKLLVGTGHVPGANSMIGGKECPF